MTQQSDATHLPSAYVDALDEIGQLRAALFTAQAEIEGLRADPLVAHRLGVWGLRAVKRLSEWDRLWDERMVPILKAAGVKNVRRPWDPAVRRYFRNNAPAKQQPTPSETPQPWRGTWKKK